jgi:hypothetical protein
MVEILKKLSCENHKTIKSFHNSFLYCINVSGEECTESSSLCWFLSRWNFTKIRQIACKNQIAKSSVGKPSSTIRIRLHSRLIEHVPKAVKSTTTLYYIFLNQRGTFRWPSNDIEVTAKNPRKTINSEMQIGSCQDWLRNRAQSGTFCFIVASANALCDLIILVTKWVFYSSSNFCICWEKLRDLKQFS